MEYKFKGTAGPWHPVEYAGFWQVQSGEFYGDTDVLDHDKVLNDAIGLGTEAVSEEKAKANAHLMAASPDLLQACIKALAELKWHPATAHIQGEIISAIHKALNISE